MLKVQALADATQLNFEIALDVLERDLFAGVARGEIDFAESASPDSALDRVPFEWPGATGVRKFHRGGSRRVRSRPLGIIKLRRLRIHGRKVLTF
jgi:hypothetical protein